MDECSGGTVGWAGLPNTAMVMKWHVNGVGDAIDESSADGFPHHRDACHPDLEYGTPGGSPHSSHLKLRAIIMRRSGMFTGGEY